MKRIALTQGKVALVDDGDFEYLSKKKWSANLQNGIWYAISGGKRMHRLILKAQPGWVVDHKNRDGLDNRRANLRVCTHAENMRNAKTRKDNASGFTGVSWYKRTSKWSARINVNNKTIYLGYFSDLALAIKAYKQASRKYHGDFSKV